MSKIISAGFILFLLFTACTEDSPLAPSQEKLVVQGYLYAGEAVTDIQLTSTLPLGSEETKAPPVNNAIVSLIKNGRSFSLVPSAGDSGYYHYDGENLSVNAGDEFEIVIEYNNTITTGRTVVPVPPEGMELSSKTLTIPESFNFGVPPDEETNSITATWNYDAASLFYVVVECIEENPVEVEQLGGMGRGSGEFRRLLVFPPTNNNEFRIQRFNIYYYGTHRIKVYRVNQEYADLYQSRNQDSRDLNEPLSNIQNG
ncbi:DUF4249 family protein, partial [candidate division KSB1 bacterium]|nr:DUF4249 family protein [candidate division KSB1 bacterium]